MSVAERVHWDRHYRERDNRRDYPAPDPMLFEYVPPIFDKRPRRALDLACGVGQNAIWLASQGYATDGVDVSRVALATAQVQAQLREVRLNLYPADLDQYEIEKNAYDVVVVMRFIKRGLMPDLRAAVRPGGRVLYQTFNTQHLHAEPDFNPEFLLRMGELVGYFADWHILHHLTVGGVSQLVAVKPDPTNA